MAPVFRFSDRHSGIRSTPQRRDVIESHGVCAELIG
jgi:hypothetical protein